jgi:hypothetical protein
MIKGHIISKDGASRLNLYNMNKNGRQTARRSEDLIVADVPNCIGTDGQPLEQIEFDISEVKGWSSINVANFRHDFLVARVRGICAVVIKKEQDSKTKKLLQNPKGQDEDLKGKVVETYKLLSQAYSDHDLFVKLNNQYIELKKELDLFHQT